MRIIAGEFRGRKIESPPGRDTRPMLDRVREALFSTLGEALDGARALDLFAGTGSLGLEAISRGAHAVRMVERDPRAQVILARNCSGLGAGERAQALRGDALAPQSWAALDGARADLAFFDPPYPLLRRGDTRRKLIEAVHEILGTAMDPDGELVFHAPRGQLSELDFPQLDAQVREYGTSALWYLSNKQPGTDAGTDAGPEDEA